MYNLRKDDKQELKVAKFQHIKGGCEILSNDGGVKIRLTKSFFNGTTFYTTSYMIKNGTGYERLEGGQPYGSIDEYMERLSAHEDYTEAYYDYIQTKKKL